MEKLVGTDATKADDFVLRNQEVAAKEGYRNVSKIWFNQTQPFEQALDAIDAGRAETQDLMATVDEMSPTVDDKGKFAFWHTPSGRTFVPTAHAVKQAAGWAGTGTWFAENLTVNPIGNKDKELFVRDIGDAETLASAFRNGFRRIDPAKKFLWRTRVDGSLRAMMTDKYAIVDNRWFLELLRSLIPDGRISHSKGDSDTIFSNILIPDTIREDTDSDYGGMLSAGNSEIGERRIKTLPSIFRAICMNGCIWGQTKGEATGRVHRGKIDLKGLALDIQSNLQKQIPLLPTVIDKFLSTRSFVWGTANAKSVVAVVAKDFKFSKRQTNSVLHAWTLEHLIAPELSRSLFGVVNAVTRAGQTFGPADWVRFDGIGGELTAYTKEDFSRLVNRANGFTVKEVDECYASAV